MFNKTAIVGVSPTQTGRRTQTQAHMRHPHTGSLGHAGLLLRLRNTRFAAAQVHTNHTTPPPRHAAPHHDTPTRPATRPHSPPQPPKRTLRPCAPPAASQPAIRPIRPRHSRVSTHRPRPQHLPPSLTARHRRRNRRGDHLPLPRPVRPSQATPGTKTGVLHGRRRGRIHRAAVEYRCVL